MLLAHAACTASAHCASKTQSCSQLLLTYPHGVPPAAGQDCIAAGVPNMSSEEARTKRSAKKPAWMTDEMLIDPAEVEA